ncbi:MAG: hypothetical protein ABRQ31_07985 [Smithellaceae bacterium]
MTLNKSEVNIQAMNTIENSLDKIAEKILHLDEASLDFLWDKYKTKMEQFSFSKEWEKSVIIFSIINSVRVKNAIFNEQLLSRQANTEKAAAPGKARGIPNLKLVK